MVHRLSRLNKPPRFFLSCRLLSVSQTTHTQDTHGEGFSREKKINCENGSQKKGDCNLNDNGRIINWERKKDDLSLLASRHVRIMVKDELGSSHTIYYLRTYKMCEKSMKKNGGGTKKNIMSTIVEQPEGPSSWHPLSPFILLFRKWMRKGCSQLS